MRIIHFLIVLVLSATAVADEAANTKTFASGDKRVALVELYTSEGCSSCPPAEKWLNKLSDSPKLWKSFVPVAFHVDYWDYLGWDDRFADNKFSKRQRLYAYQFGERTVYTPGIRVGGEEFRGWRKSDLNRLDNDAKVGSLRVSVDDQGNVDASFDNQLTSLKKYRINVALLGMGLETEVLAGENKGRALLHDFVVFEVTKLKRSANHFVGNLNAKAYPDNQLAIAAWVDTDDDLIPVQATGGFLGKAASSYFKVSN